MTGSSPNLVVEAEMIRLRRIAEWQQAVAQVGTQEPISEAKQHYNAMMALGQARYQNQLQYQQGALSQQAQNIQPAPDIQQAVAQALGALAVLSECSLYAMGQSLMGIGAFVDPVAEPVVVAASKPVNRALARAMGCGSRQAIGFMVR